MRFKHGLLAGFFFLVPALLIIIVNPKETEIPGPIRGMTISCQTWGYEWATPEMKSTLIDLKQLGVNWFAIHPYARIYKNGAIKFDSNLQQPHLTTPLNWANELGLNVMLKPHLAYWGSGFQWRGDIQFSNEEHWQRFFTDYKKWIVVQAQIAEKYGAELFCIGTEYDKTTVFEQQWRQIISEIRSHYSGKLVYAANWDNYQNVPFWDALDFIGIQAYFPLSSLEKPGKKDLQQGWQEIYAELIPFSDRYGKQIIFTELGYDASELSASKPWLGNGMRTKSNRDLQKLCLDVALDEASGQPAIAGIFLWKWFAEIGTAHHREDYNLQTPEIRRIISANWNNN